MIVPPGCKAPLASAASTIDRAMRSLIEPPGLPRSDLIQTSAFGNIRASRMCGVPPIVSRTLLAFMTVAPDGALARRMDRRGLGARPGV